MVGDPLYRPFARPVDEQIAAGGPDLPWAYVRKVNLLVDRLDDALAEKLCREQATRLRSAVLQEKLGDLLLAQKRRPAASEAWQQALTMPGPCVERVAVKLARAYEAGQQPALALAVYEGLLAGRLKADWCRKARDLAELTGRSGQAQQWQAKLDELLRQPAGK
jgi:tetratricopeptide (TPR) repeat protein